MAARSMRPHEGHVARRLPLLALLLPLPARADNTAPLPQGYLIWVQGTAGDPGRPCPS